MFAGSVLHMKMRPPRAGLGAVPTGLAQALCGGGGSGGRREGAAHSLLPLVRPPPALEAGASGRETPGVRLSLPSTLSPSVCERQGEGSEGDTPGKALGFQSLPSDCEGQKRGLEQHAFSILSPGSVSGEAAGCVDIRRTQFQAPIWASYFTSLGLSLPTCKMGIIMPSQ